MPDMLWIEEKLLQEDNRRHKKKVSQNIKQIKNYSKVTEYITKRTFFLLLFVFNVVSTFAGYLKPNASLQKNSSGII